MKKYLKYFKTALEHSEIVGEYKPDEYEKWLKNEKEMKQCVEDDGGEEQTMEQYLAMVYGDMDN